MKNLVFGMKVAGIDAAQTKTFEDNIISSLKSMNPTFALNKIYNCDYKEGLFNICDAIKADILVVNELLPGEGDFLQLIKNIKTQLPNIQIIVLLADERPVGDAMLATFVTLGIYNWLVSPWKPMNIADAILNQKQLSDVEIYMPKIIANEKGLAFDTVVIEKDSHEKNGEIRDLTSIKDFVGSNNQIESIEDISDLNKGLTAVHTKVPTYRSLLGSSNHNIKDKVQTRHIVELNDKPVNFMVTQNKEVVHKEVKEVKPVDIEKKELLKAEEQKVEEVKEVKEVKEKQPIVNDIKPITTTLSEGNSLMKPKMSRPTISRPVSQPVLNKDVMNNDETALKMAELLNKVENNNLKPKAEVKKEEKKEVVVNKNSFTSKEPGKITLQEKSKETVITEKLTDVNVENKAEKALPELYKLEDFEFNKAITSILFLNVLPTGTRIPMEIANLLSVKNNKVRFVDLVKGESYYDQFIKDGKFTENNIEVVKSTFKSYVPEKFDGITVAYAVTGNGIDKVIELFDKVIVIAPQDKYVVKTFVDRYEDVLPNNSLLFIDNFMNGSYKPKDLMISEKFVDIAIMRLETKNHDIALSAKEYNKKQSLVNNEKFINTIKFLLEYLTIGGNK